MLRTEKRAMREREHESFLIGRDDPILITGATGFIGSRLVRTLLALGFRRLRCLVRSPWKAGELQALSEGYPDGGRIEVVQDNLLSRDECVAATKDVKAIFHLAAARGEKSVPSAFMNSVVTTRNLLDAALGHGCLRRFVSVSSFSVYANTQKSGGCVLDEISPVHAHPERLGDAYCFA